jgi:inhibitor of KinA
MSRIVPMGDACLSIVFDEILDESVNARCVRLAEELVRRPLEGILDVVPGFHSVSVYFDRRRIGRDDVRVEIERAESDPAAVRAGPSAAVEIAVSYGGEGGPDLASVAAFADCSEDEVIRRHTQATYRVYMLGFLPGFAYLAPVDRRIAMPRLETPRTRVPAGSVGIAGQQTGIYPCDSPGGWRIIGRTSMRIFDADRGDPSLLKPGDRVKFVAA